MSDARVNVNARIEADLLARIDAIARSKDRTRSDMIRLLLKDAVEAEEKAAGRATPAAIPSRVRPISRPVIPPKRP